MSRTGQQSEEPRAVIHKRILNVADEMPDASLEEVAEEVSGASAELVDRVLAEYGDPGDEPSDEPVDGDGGDAEPTDSADGDDMDGPRSDLPELSKEQWETLEVIARKPDATQREIAAELDVTAATVSRWVNDIPGFDWSNRESFATRVLDDGPVDTADSEGDTDEIADSDDSPDATPAPTDSSADAVTGGVVVEMNGNAENGRTGGNTASEGDGASEIADLRRRVVALEDRLAEDRPEKESGNAATGAVDGDCDDAGFDRIDTELLHKVVNACMSSEHMTEEEEIRLLDHLRD
ncbi:MAG: MarR family transcriptional regulator [Halobacteriales archaeon]